MKIIKMICVMLLTLHLGVATANPIDINISNASTLATTMKGVGLKKAQAIVEYRTEYGNFKTIDDLTMVKGIGQKTVDKNRDKLMVKETTQKK